MVSTVTITDETTSGRTTNTFVLALMSERITVRELIRERVYEEVRLYNASQPTHFKGLVQPTEAEHTLNGYKVHHRRPLDWQKQFDEAISAFERNGFFILVNDRQVDNLDDEVLILPNTVVSFIKLVPLVGG